MPSSVLRQTDFVKSQRADRLDDGALGNHQLDCLMLRHDASSRCRSMEWATWIGLYGWEGQASSAERLEKSYGRGHLHQVSWCSCSNRPVTSVPMQRGRSGLLEQQKVAW